MRRIRTRADGEEVRAVLPTDLPQINHSQVEFVDEHCGLQGMAAPLARHTELRGAMQLFVDQWG